MKEGGRGIRVRVTDEQIREWRKIPLVERLRWLEELNEFLLLVHDEKTRARWEAFRKGEI